ncbi:MAG: DUF4493 domain-containing protein, partial [Muribaculaceae bacterium]|nr:DUF4493 domain-containing protein [Muribaculaceae bacterium]
GEAAGEGRVLLRPSVSTDFKASRALGDDEIQQLSESCLIWISSEKGLVRKYDGIQSVPAEGIKLVGGQYTAEAWAGDSVPASFDTRYYKGVEPFTISAGGTTQVDLKCTVANTAVSVKYGEAIDDVLSDYTLTVGHSCGKLTWEGRDERRGYFMMNSRDKDLAYTLTGTRQDGTTYTLNGTIEAVKPATEYVLNVKYEGIDVETGGAYFTIEIDESTVDMVDEIVIISAPNIMALYDQNLDKPIYGEAHKFTRQGFFIASATKLKSVYVSAPSMAAEIGVNGGEFDVVRVDDTVLAELANAGVKVVRSYNAEQDIDNVKLTFEEDLLNRLTDGTYEINVEASIELPADDEGAAPIIKSSRATMTIVISDADVETTPMAANDPGVWSTQATLSGKVLKDGVENAGLNYREKGTQEWIYVDGVASRAETFSKGQTYTVTITGLTPATTYEYVAVAGDFVATTICEFTTDAEAQLPNAGFEEWFIESGSRKPYYVAASSDANSLFWDSGNHGSCTLGVNITSPDETIKHSGDYSIKMASQKVAMLGIGAFAAGNVFAGQFLGTENTTKGILGWGRPWTARPRALKGYIKYTPAAITEVGGAPDGVKVSAGDMDAGIIYIALVDDTTMKYGNYGPWPQIVATKDINNYGFKSSAPNVIAYGERVFTDAIGGTDSMVEFEIPIDYKRTDIKPSNIIVVASASRYGDYYTGGPSVMYLDDLELIY